MTACRLSFAYYSGRYQYSDTKRSYMKISMTNAYYMQNDTFGVPLSVFLSSSSLVSDNYTVTNCLDPFIAAILDVSY